MFKTMWVQTSQEFDTLWSCLIELEINIFCFKIGKTQILGLYLHLSFHIVQHRSMLKQIFHIGHVIQNAQRKTFIGEQ